MDLEKLVNRARSMLYVLVLVGLIVVTVGVVYTYKIMTLYTSVLSMKWQQAIGPAGPMILVICVGVLIALLPLLVLPLVGVMVRRAYDQRYRIEQLLGAMEAQRHLLENIRETASLSDAAKQVAYRQKDLEALRAAIREDIERGDFEAALMLANEMERRFGYQLEANKLRDQVHQTSKAAIDARVQETVQHVELLCGRHDWSDATKESERLLRAFPNHAEAKRMPDRIAAARDGHKRELLKQWKDAVAKDDVDRSVELLKQLDQYLSPGEAEAYKDSARDVFKKRLQQLGVQFALHVHDKSWTEALRIGKQINDEFPNTRMASEVRERMLILQEKAQQPLGVG